ncbi:hypothetical protein K440DRAFT_609682 [Wilcoxina mikolae CBS 423.85]|nr:hypothetical protein K440DRAFT_609682 [Wilcoxina mikolae CBS 423.85]
MFSESLWCPVVSTVSGAIIWILAAIIFARLAIQKTRLYRFGEAGKPFFEDPLFCAIHNCVTGLSWVILVQCMASFYLSPTQMKATIIALVVILGLGAGGVWWWERRRSQSSLAGSPKDTIPYERKEVKSFADLEGAVPPVVEARDEILPES